MADAYVKVGFPASRDKQHKDSVQTIAQVAVENEYGVPEKNIPSRPFMRQALDKNENKLHERIKQYAKDIYGGLIGTHKAMALLGSEHKGDIEKEIRTGDFKPNAPLTIAIKGSSRPLIDTGQMVQSVQFEIGKGKTI
ncbi:hypothetical protein HY641_03390 [Candidatus Woesearchaeota archaeon]|nr:hypothetical protein [Candidatus Woesearchaeota archaeon]